eukprot:COSAG02_NODE_5762_length_4059_cov_82.697451_2_plen_1197_part_01
MLDSKGAFAALESLTVCAREDVHTDVVEGQQRASEGRQRRICWAEMSVRRSARAAAAARPIVVDSPSDDSEDSPSDDGDFSSSEQPKRKAVPSPLPRSPRTKKPRMRQQEEPWPELWERLSAQGWRQETGKRVGTDAFYIPPGVSRQAAGMRCRRDFFDSKLQVRQYLRREAGDESEPEDTNTGRPAPRRPGSVPGNCPGETGHADLEHADVGEPDLQAWRRRRPATRAAANDYDWQPTDGVYPQLKLDSLQSTASITPQLRLQLRTLGRRGGVVPAPFVLPSEYELSMHSSSNDQQSSFLVNRSQQRMLQAKMVTFDGARTGSFGYTSSEDETESDSDDYAVEESSDDNTEVLDGDGSNYEVTVPRPDATQRMLGDLLAMFHHLRTFGPLLNLTSSFTLEQFMCSLACPRENVLISDIHVNLLSEIKRDEILPEIQKSNEASQRSVYDHHLLCWLSLNRFTWPELVRRQAERRTTAQDRYVADLAFVVEQNLRAKEYWTLPTGAKVEILRFLCDSAMSSKKVNDAIESGSTVPLRSLGRDSSQNRYWLVGGQIFRESLTTGEFFACSEAEIQKWKTSKRQGTVRERNLAKQVRDNFAQVLVGRLPDTLVSAFMCPRTQVDGEPSEAGSKTMPAAFATVPRSAFGQVLIHGVKFQPQSPAEIAPAPAYYGNATPNGLILRYDVRAVVGLTDDKRIRADIAAQDPCSTLQQTRARMVGLAEWLPLVLFVNGWTARRPGWIEDVLAACTGSSLALLLLEFRENMKDIALSKHWHDGEGFVHELQEHDPQRLASNVFRPLVNAEMNAYILANSGRGGRTGRSSGRGPRSRKGRGRAGKSAKGGRGKGRLSSKLYLGRTVKDFFEGHGEFIGQVISVDDSEEPWLYKVRFEDGDIQEYDLHELRTVVQAPAKPKQKPKKAEAVDLEAAEPQEAPAYVTTTKSGRRSVSRLSIGATVDSQLNATWRLGEIRQLQELVERDGIGDWDAKATALGTGRTGTSVESKYYYEKREEATVQSRQGNKRRSSHADKCTLPGCDGSGHRSGNFAHHRAINACPNATAEDIIKYSRVALQAQMITYYQSYTVQQTGCTPTTIPAGMEPEIVNSYLYVAAQLRSNPAVRQLAKHRPEPRSQSKAETMIQNTGDPELDALKIEYLRVIGRKPRGRFQNSKDWLQKCLNDAGARTADAEPDDSNEQPATLAPP